MALYNYAAGGKNTPVKNVQIEADNPADAVNKLRRAGLYPVRFLGEGEMARETGAFARKKVDVDDFTRELAVLLKNHVPLEKALALIAESANSADQREFVNAMRRGLHEGKRFSELVRRQGNVFPPFYANLIETGEESGCLPEVVVELRKFMEESRALREFIVTSSIYPAVILAVCLIMMVLLFVVFVPKFAGVFSQMGRELPGAMRFLMGLSGFFKYAWWAIPLAAVAAHLTVKKAMGAARLSYLKSALLLKLPIFGKLASDLDMCRYMRTLSILLGNHVDIIKTVRLAAGALKLPPIKQTLADLEGKLRSGAKLSAALAGRKYVPNGAAAMLRMGEESGETAQMAAGVADRLDEETRRKIKRLLSMFEPLVIVLLAGVILVVVAAIFISILEMNSINGG